MAICSFVAFPPSILHSAILEVGAGGGCKITGVQSGDSLELDIIIGGGAGKVANGRLVFGSDFQHNCLVRAILVLLNLS